MSKHFVLDENHNLIEAYSAQEVLSVLEQAIADGSLANVVAGQAIIDKIKCCVTGGTMQVAFVTQAKYNELKSSGSIIGDCLYIITDDTTADDAEQSLVTLTNAVNDLINTVSGMEDGRLKVKHSELADRASNADRATQADSAVRANSASYAETANNATNAETASLVMNTRLYPDGSGTITLHATGVYICVMAKYDSGSISEYQTCILAIPSLTKSSYALTDKSIYIYYDGSSRSIKIKNSTSTQYTLVYAARIYEGV